jgi:glutathione S-transferase
LEINNGYYIRRKGHALLVCASPNTLKNQPANLLSRLEKSRSQRILWLLEELNVPYEVKTFKRGKDMLAPKELREIHPLGKSPVISVQSSATPKPIVIAESGMIVEYLCDHFGGDKLIPTRYAEGKEGQIGGETEEWLRYRYYMHFSEGSLMPFLVFKLVTDSEFFE